VNIMQYNECNDLTVYCSGSIVAAVYLLVYTMVYWNVLLKLELFVFLILYSLIIYVKLHNCVFSAVDTV
jgi:hypothetical protein